RDRCVKHRPSPPPCNRRRGISPDPTATVHALAQSSRLAGNGGDPDNHGTPPHFEDVLMGRTWLIALVAALTSPLTLTLATRADEKEEAEPKGFTKLFNGKDTTGWKAHNGDTKAWTVEDGVLGVNGKGGWLMTEKEYGDFELRLEYKLPKM